MNKPFIAILINPRAGKGRAIHLAKNILKELDNQKISYEIFTGSWPETLIGFSNVFVIGGDGTLNHLINLYKDIKIPISIFKGGSGNDFAWKLYKDKSAEQYLQSALNGNTVEADAGICNGRIFVNGTGIGFDAEIVRSMGKKRFFSSGHLAYLWVVFSRIFIYNEEKYQLEFNNEVVNERLFMISVANGSRYGGGFLVAPQAMINDGKLDLVMIKPVRPFKRFFYLPKVEKGVHIHLPFVRIDVIKNIRISSHTPMHMHMDGELFESGEFSIQILPARFKFTV